MSKYFSKQISIITTHNCNLNCTYCSFSNKNKTFKEYMDIKTINTFLRFIFNYFKEAERLQFLITGGEPLLNKNILKRIIKNIKFCSKYYNKKIVICMPTNGVYIDNEILEFFRTNKSLVLFSNDGLIGKSNSYRGISNNNFTSKIKLLLSYDDVINIRMTIFPNLAALMYRNFMRYKKLGFSKVDIFPVIGFYWPENEKRIFLKNYDKIIQYHVKHKIPFWSTNEFDSSICPKFNSGGMVLDTDGTFYPCWFYMSLPKDIAYKYNIGNINQGFKADDSEILKLNNYKICEKSNLIKGLTVKEKCNDCQPSKSCYKLCLGYSLKEKRFLPEILESTWQLLRGMGEVEKKYKNQLIKFEL